MRRVLVTGGAGFVGRPAVAALAARGFEVHAVGRRAPEGVHVFHPADLLDAQARRAAVRAAGAGHLLHLAWVTEPGRYWQAPENLDWTAASLDLVRGFREAGGTRAVVAGTCAEYDWTGIAPLSRAEGAGIHRGHLSESAPCRPATLYGAAKDGLRRVLTGYAASTGLSLAWGRLFYLYGPGEAPGRLVGDAARALLDGRRFATSEGRQRRDFLHVMDAGDAFAALLDSAVEGPVNIGSGASVPVRTLLETLGRLTGRPDLIDFGARPLPPTEPACIEADIRRLTGEVGFHPHLDLDEGLRATLAAYAAR
ncbi:NAD-dependent dehydratase [Methylobacterium sp. Leaf456]|uniref:NAD-dependent epimerase/dehydratase family protein n=1 Tax=Methylobacterium sp. Leaf456 TaxID=1736382 RepID=UPI0006FA12BB|nr:NAD(P)-dependent oxidoreductase [Methylobacterium sp. Leaf456]KQT46827.1 NAD-dependent dehydratase [Methylobacterium sp. Leaf456]